MKKIADWLSSQCARYQFDVRIIPLSELSEWFYDEAQGRLAHRSGRFFTINGLAVDTNFGRKPYWEQPIIDQPEVGVLGIISTKSSGVRRYLLQAKMEPGNVNVLQLSPSVQATRSNYTQIHKGRRPKFLEYFLDHGTSKVWIDRLQQEQGGRFYNKLNRNMLVEVNEEFDAGEEFIWLTGSEINSLLRQDNLINMDTRTVLSCMLSPEPGERPVHAVTELLNWLCRLQSSLTLTSHWVPLRGLKEWQCTPEIIQHVTGEHFQVVGVSVKAGNREVSSWTQPMFKEDAVGLVGFVTKRIDGTVHFLVQGIYEAGKRFVTFAPTVQCSNYLAQSSTPYLEQFLKGRAVLYDQIHSEEGGRFYHYQNRNMIVAVSEDLEVRDNYIWMTFNQIIELIGHGYFNIEARTLIVCWNSLDSSKGFVDAQSEELAGGRCRGCGVSDSKAGDMVLDADQ